MPTAKTSKRIPKWLTAKGFDKVPKFYKELGFFAAKDYLRMTKGGKSTKHWTLPYGDYKFVFFETISRAKVAARLKSVRKANPGEKYPYDPVLNMWSLNKPLNYEFRR